MKSILLAALVTPLVFGQNIQSQKDTTQPLKAGRYVTCGDPKSPKESFDPICSVRIFGDFGGRKRTVLLECPAAPKLNRSAALNDIVARANIHRSVPVPNI